jgi:lipoate-protein ligase B
MRLQDALVEEVRAQPHRGFILASQPTATFTAGISAKSEDLLWSKEMCERAGIQIRPVHRGGKWTYHGPGQVVLFPIFQMNQVFPRTRVRGFLETFQASLQSAIQKTASISINLADSTSPVGLYHEGHKLTSFGVGIRRGITTFGAAVYLEGFQPIDGIVPCGHNSRRYATLQSLNWPHDWPTTARLLSENLAQSLQSTRVKEFSSRESLIG